MDNIKVLASKVKNTIQRDGIGSVAKKSVTYIKAERDRRILEKSIGKSFKDVLIIMIYHIHLDIELNTK